MVTVHWRAIDILFIIYTVVPTILVRRHCVLIIFDPIRAVILSNELLFIVPDGAGSILQLLEAYIKSEYFFISHLILFGYQLYCSTRFGIRMVEWK